MRVLGIILAAVAVCGLYAASAGGAGTAQKIVISGTADVAINLTAAAATFGAAGDSAIGDVYLSSGSRWFYLHAYNEDVTISGWVDTTKAWPTEGDTAWTVPAGTDLGRTVPYYERVYTTRSAATGFNYEAGL